MLRDRFLAEMNSRENFSQEAKYSILNGCSSLERSWREYYSMLKRNDENFDDYIAFRKHENNLYERLLEILHNENNPNSLRRFLLNGIEIVENLNRKIRQDIETSKLNMVQQYFEIDEILRPYFEEMRHYIIGEVNFDALTKIILKWNDRYIHKEAIINRIANRNRFQEFKEKVLDKMSFSKLSLTLVPKETNQSNIKVHFDNEEYVNFFIKKFVEYIDLIMPLDYQAVAMPKNLKSELKNYESAFNLIPNCCAIEIIDYLASKDHLSEKNKQQPSKRRNFKNSKNKFVSIPNKLLVLLHDIIYSHVVNDENKILDDDVRKGESMKSLLRSNIPVKSVAALTAYENYKLGLL